MGSLKDKTLFVTGASRGIGLAIAKRAARDGARIAIAAKTDSPNPKLEGTVHSAAEEIMAAGGQALPIVCDIRDEDQVQRAVDQAAATFGGIDICVNNASAISLTPIEKTELKRFDLMFQINTRGTFAVSKACLPHLKRAQNPHILMMSPPLDMNARWFAGHVAYSIAKYGMSLCVLGLAEELKKDGVAVNALWPRTTIATAAIRNVLGGDKLMSMSRTPDILADAAHLVFQQPARTFTGQFLIDDTFLHEVGGVTDFEAYRVDPSKPLAPDFFVPADSNPPPGVTLARLSELAWASAKNA
ncbi:MAG TPA: NAD(P)-dependent oxidoreductase [Hyphomicrobium sp.]|nr:NAD(P)-dependent oxidoreductase [Hyphomicrobium sp.]